MQEEVIARLQKEITDAEERSRVAAEEADVTHEENVQRWMFCL